MKRENIAIVLGMFETGLGVGRSLGRVGIPVIGLDHSKKIGFYSRYIKAKVCPSPITRQIEFINFLIEIAKKEKKPPVIFVASDDYISCLSKHQELLSNYCLLNFPDRTLINNLCDKIKQYGLIKNADIPTPETYSANDKESWLNIDGKINYPLFIKGADVTKWRKAMGASLKGFEVHSYNELINIYQTVYEKESSFLIQELIPGADSDIYQISCYVSQNGKILSAFGLKKLRQQPARFGFGCLTQSVEYPELLDLGKKLFLNIGYRGIGSAEFKLDARDGTLKFIELNPRYWQQNALAEKCGMNFPLIQYLDLVGLNPEPCLDYRKEVKWVNIFSDIESLREYRNLGELTIRQWLKSLKGEKVYSIFSRDDILPGLHDIFVDNAYHRIKRNIKKRLTKAPSKDHENNSIRNLHDA